MNTFIINYYNFIHLFYKKNIIITSSLDYNIYFSCFKNNTKTTKRQNTKKLPKITKNHVICHPQ